MRGRLSLRRGEAQPSRADAWVSGSRGGGMRPADHEQEREVRCLVVPWPLAPELNAP